MFSNLYIFYQVQSQLNELYEIFYWFPLKNSRVWYPYEYNYDYVKPKFFKSNLIIIYHLISKHYGSFQWKTFPTQLKQILQRWTKHIHHNYIKFILCTLPVYCCKSLDTFHLFQYLILNYYLGVLRFFILLN